MKRMKQSTKEWTKMTTKVRNQNKKVEKNFHKKRITIEKLTK